ncbi:hypothetical protein K504DRAFT_460149 [Pleomassaria siparia CBS 279.74]|uniref:Methyltransferase domain-containing protein n=1 Tax=Pleomassaria siparia CBS 279.74 TaxID=1314801 RepID=A0A6G1K0M3_9PLEO|nr:hypothetical protein K504DRAFT_460149 [Pleomassaria siparia CBS 279.74]
MAGVVPKQAKAFLAGRNKVTTYESTGGKVTADFASHMLTLIPPIPAGSVIHDNMSGAGTVSRKILSSSDSGPPTTDIEIDATDMDQVFLDVLQADVTAQGWPMRVSKQDANALSFPDEHFTHSLTNMGIFFTGSGGLEGAREMHRTLKPGGIAVANCWESVSWFLPVRLVHDAVRPGKPYPAPAMDWSDGKRLRGIMREAGFSDDEDNVKMEKQEAWTRTSDLRGWAERVWAFLGGLGTWQESDEETWDRAVDLLVEKLEGLTEAQGVKVVDGETWLRASQWVVVAMKSIV